jgi:hypothetical protein
MTPEARAYWMLLTDDKARLAFERQDRFEKAEVVAKWLKEEAKK